MIFKCLVLIFLVLVVGCGQLTGESTGANVTEKSVNIIGGLQAIIVGESTYLFAGESLKGGNASHNFKFNFNLPEKQKITFVFFGNRSLSTGAFFTFERKNGEVNLTIQLNGKEHTVLLPIFTDVELVDIDLDFHNDHSDAHIIIWRNSGSRDDSEGCSYNGGCLYNTEDYALDVWLGVGRAAGTFWGMKGNKEFIKTVNGPSAPYSKK